MRRAHTTKETTKETTTTSPRTPRNCAGGGAAVEFALVLPLFMLLVMGALDYGYFFFSSQIVTNAAREGARAGTLVNPTAPSASTTAGNNARAVALAYMNGNGVSCPGGAGDAMCIVPSFPTVSGSPAVQVRISYATPSLTGFTSVILPNSIQAQAVMLWGP